MKKSFNIFLASLVFILSMAGCSDRGSFQGNYYKSYGIFDEHKFKNPNVQYEVAVVPLVVSAIVMLFVSGWFGLIGLLVTIGWFLNVPSDAILEDPENRGIIK